MRKAPCQSLDLPSSRPARAATSFRIIRYDARAGRIFRMDRALGDGGFVTDKVDITDNFKALADFENIEAGWIDMQPGQAPSMVLVQRAADMLFPPCPSDNHKQGIRFLLKLANDCGGGQPPVREVSANSGAFLSGGRGGGGEVRRREGGASRPAAGDHARRPADAGQDRVRAAQVDQLSPQVQDRRVGAARRRLRVEAARGLGTPVASPSNLPAKPRRPTARLPPPARSVRRRLRRAAEPGGGFFFRLRLSDMVGAGGLILHPPRQPVCR